jgi:hypothetical protein
MSLFFVAYGPTLCPTSDRNIGRCLHEKSCTSCCNETEFYYHPENYHIFFCETVSTHIKCLKSRVCPHAHHSKELRVRANQEEQLNSLAYCARYQMWPRVIELLTKLPPGAEEHISRDIYPYSRETVLHYAAKYCKTDVIIALLNHSPKLDLNQKDIFGQIPIHKAAGYAGGGDPESDWQGTLEKLIENKADPLYL